MNRPHHAVSWGATAVVLTAWLIVLLLILVNGLYVAAEFSTVSVRSIRIRQLAGKGNNWAKQLLPVLDDPQQLDRYVAACQIGITISSLILGAYSQATIAVELRPLVQTWVGLGALAAQSVASASVLFGITTLQVVLGELVPKSLALQFSAPVALYTVWPMRWSLVLYTYTGFLPALNGSGLAILRMLGMPQTSHRHLHRPEEIDLLLAESRDGGLLEPDEHLRLHRALRLSARTARQIMTPRVHVEAIDADLPSEAFLHQVLSSSYSRLPVYRESIDTIIGMVNVKDVVAHYVAHGQIPSVQAVMRPVQMVPDTLPADDLLRRFREQRTQQVVVGDEFGGIAGVVTLEDVLEEVLGDLSDDYRAAGQPVPEQLPDGRIRLPGLMHLDEAMAWLGVRWHSRAATVAGHILLRLNRVPQAGEHVTIDGLDVEIERTEQSAVVSLLVVPVHPAKEPDDE